MPTRDSQPNPLLPSPITGSRWGHDTVQGPQHPKLSSICPWSHAKEGTNRGVCVTHTIN
jgi:hypothetical protein